MPNVQRLTLNGRTVVAGLDPALSLERDPTGVGVFVRARAAQTHSFHRFRLGDLPALQRFTGAYRYDPFWMRPVAGTTTAEILPETQYLLAERRDGLCVLIVPLFDDPFRFSLSGDVQGLQLVGETGDAFCAGTGGLAAFVALGRDPCALAAAGARAVQKRLRAGRLRGQKPLPNFVDQFGWCTWDAFYQEVSPEKVREGLESFAAGGVEPRLLILDDGWLDAAESPLGGSRLVSLNARARFGGTLAPTVRMAKGQFKVRTFLVWHAFGGYWAGIDPARLPAYGARDVARLHGPGILRHTPDANQFFGASTGHIPANRIAAFYEAFHRRIKSWGVDGVKVDNQSSIEGLATAQGGRVGQYRVYRRALEASVRKHFDGRLINCMSNANEIHMMCRDSSLLRTSTDFWPNLPASHGAHLYANAQVGVWFGQFIHPDWDMFQSGHAWGAFHAAGRAVSGGPVYVSDKPGAHDFALLRKLVFADGGVARADRPGVPTRDCLFRDPTREDVLLKIVNHNGDRAVIGVFNCRQHEDAAQRRTLAGRVSPTDAWPGAGTARAEYAVYTHTTGRLRRVRGREAVRVRLAEGGWEIVTLAPVRRGLAVIGLADKLNSGGAVVARRDAPGACVVTLRDGGDFLAWCGRAPRRVRVNGREVPFTYRPGTGALAVRLENAGRQRVRIEWRA